MTTQDIIDYIEFYGADEVPRRDVMKHFELSYYKMAKFDSSLPKYIEVIKKGNKKYYRLSRNIEYSSEDSVYDSDEESFKYEPEFKYDDDSNHYIINIPRKLSDSMISKINEAMIDKIHDLLADQPITAQVNMIANYVDGTKYNRYIRNNPKFGDDITKILNVKQEEQTGSDVQFDLSNENTAIDSFELYVTDYFKDKKNVKRTKREGNYLKEYLLSELITKRYQKSSINYDVNKVCKDLVNDYQIYSDLNIKENNNTEHCIIRSVKVSKHPNTSAIIKELQSFNLTKEFNMNNLKTVVKNLDAVGIHVNFNVYNIESSHKKIYYKSANKEQSTDINLVLYKTHYMFDGEVKGIQMRTVKSRHDSVSLRVFLKHMNLDKAFKPITSELISPQNTDRTLQPDLVNYYKHDGIDYSDYKPYASNPKEFKGCNELTFVADFESTTNGDYHRAYSVAVGNIAELCNEYKNRGAQIKDSYKFFYGRDCPSSLIDYLLRRGIEFNKDKTKKEQVKRIICFFHNLTYDAKMILSKLNTHEARGVRFHGRTMSLVVNFKGYKIEFRDSLQLINARLKEIPKMVGIEGLRKEVYPYSLYNSFDSNSLIGSLDDAKESIANEFDYDVFLQNLKELGLLYNDNTFDMKGYCEYYNVQDILVLAVGLQTFKQMYEEVLDMNLFAYLTLPSLAQDYFNVHCYSNIDELNTLNKTLKAFEMKAVYGGRCMTKNYKQQHVTERLCDFDATSLYPSAMRRCYVLKGIPTQLTTEMKNLRYLLDHTMREEDLEPSNERFISGFTIAVKLTRLNEFTKSLGISNVRAKNDKTSEVKYINSVDDIDNDWLLYGTEIAFQDYDEWNGLEGEVIDGYYWTSGRDYSCRECIQKLFDMRLDLKSKHNPAEQTVKLVMNSSYGKTIMKTVEKTSVYINKDQIDRFIERNHTSIVSTTEHKSSNLVLVELLSDKNDDDCLCFFGTRILDMSKRIMTEVFNLAQANGIKIYYTDTDSGHFRECDLPVIDRLYYEKYHRELIPKEGKQGQLGQFHSDFDYLYKYSKNMPVSKELLALSKKVYCDCLTVNDEQGVEHIGFHVRCKGVSHQAMMVASEKLYPECIRCTKQGGLFVPVRDVTDPNECCIWRLYKDLSEGKTIPFNLVEAGPCFDTRGMVVKSLDSFIRRVRITNEKDNDYAD